MKTIIVTTLATVLAMSFTLSANAAQKHKASAEIQASCKAQAAKKYSAIHFIKRRNFVNDCIARHNTGQPKSTTGQGGSAQPQSIAPAQAPKASNKN